MLDHDGNYIEVISVKHTLKCECGGELKYAGEYFKDEETELFKYKHICNKCRKRLYFHEIFPYPEYIEIPAPKEEKKKKFWQRKKK